MAIPEANIAASLPFISNAIRHGEAHFGYMRSYMSTPAAGIPRTTGYQIVMGGVTAALIGIISGIYLWWPSESPAEAMHLAPAPPQRPPSRAERLHSPSPFGMVTDAQIKEAPLPDIPAQSGDGPRTTSPSAARANVRPVKPANALLEHRP